MAYGQDMKTTGYTNILILHLGTDTKICAYFTGVMKYDTKQQKHHAQKKKRSLNNYKPYISIV